jgi:hypothetical protein
VYPPAFTLSSIPRYAAFQGVHYPLEVPELYFNRYSEQGAGEGDCNWQNQPTTSNGVPQGFACDPDAAYPGLAHVGLSCVCNRLIVKAQVSALSEGVGNITAALRAAGLWETTVLVGVLLLLLLLLLLLSMMMALMVITVVIKVRVMIGWCWY